MNKISVTFIVVLICAAAVFAMRQMRPDPETALKARLGERSLGSEKAPVWITEYFDYQCPPCALASKELDEEIAAQPTRIYLQVRYFPLPNHKNALKAAVYAECASKQKGKFWKFHKELLERQKDWALDPYAQIKFAAYAEKAGLDLRSLDTCAHDPSVEKAVLEEKKKGEELGVQTTPSFFVNGKIAVGLKALKEQLRTALETKMV